MLMHAPCFPKVEMGLVWAVARPSGVFRVPQVSVASSPQPTETDPSGCCHPPWTHWAPVDTGGPHVKAVVASTSRPHGILENGLAQGTSV